jgi:DNA-binding CsgD family transcriptional regulator
VFSQREREIVALTMAGESAPAIAAALIISERTAESHLARAYAKLGMHSKLEFARRATELGVGF